MKEEYIAHVLEEYIADGNFDAIFGAEWIDGQQLSAIIPQVCDRAFAQYGIDAQGKYADEVAAIFEGLQANNGIVRHGDAYSDFWYRLRPPYKQKYMTELREKNSATKKIRTLGDEALRRALNKVVAEDGLRSMEQNGKVVDEPGLRTSEEAQPVDFSDTTSPNPDFFKSETRRQKFVKLTEHTISEVEKSELSNADKSQAQGYLTAARALSETPDPPIDLIWTILNRANSLAGIGSFFLALIALIAAVA